MDPLDRAETPFFHEEDNKHLIERLASLRNLLIYAGAGVTINQTGLDWRGLMRSIQADGDETDKALRSQFLDIYGERAIGSILEEKFRGRGDDWRSRLTQELQRVLYREGGWAEGRLALTIGRLASTWAQLEDHSVCVVTTNYEDYLEQAIRDVCASKGPAGRAIPVNVLPDPRGRISLKRGAVNLLYLHGFLPHEGAEHTSERRPSLGPPVVSESDYHGRISKTVRRLVSLFRNHSLLIVGCGMGDEPLLRALVETHSDQVAEKRAGDRSKSEIRDAEGNVAEQGSGQRYDRYAVLPIQAREWNYASREELEGLRRYFNLRLQHLGLEPVYPDFYFQVSQLLEEIELASRRHRYSARNSTISYGRRLRTWWNEWSSKHLGDDWVGYQTSHHVALQAELAILRRQDFLWARNSEVLKLELWLRWEPDESRKLRLWASSMCLFDDLAAMREGELSTMSEYVSVQVFCGGSPRRVPHRSDGPHPKGRWGVYLASPIWVPDREGSELPVGMITLASQSSVKDSCLRDEHIRRFRSALAEIQQTGLMIAIGRPEKVSPHTPS